MAGIKDTLAELLSFSRDAANRTRSNQAPSPCVDCKRTIEILPLRYGVVASQDKESVKALAPQLPANLGKALKSTALTGSRYAVRCLREGYVYVFVKRRDKDFTCEATYRAHETGLLQPVWPHDPGQPITGIQGLGSWLITIGDPEDIDEARMLFTPDPLSANMLKRYRDVSVFRNRLQKFDLRTLALSCGNFEDVVNPVSLDSTVAEYLATKNARAKAVLERQSFPPFRSGLNPGETPRDMGSLLPGFQAKLIESRGVAVVLNDALGIVQELNAWRNDAIEINRPWLQQVDNEGISNERRLAVANALDEIKEAMQKGYVDNAVENARKAPGKVVLANAGWTMSSQLNEAYQDMYDPARVQARAAREAPHAFDRYQKLLDWDGAKARVQTEFSRRDKLAQREMDQREADHLVWLGSDLLKQAIDLYDRKEPVWGQAFAEQIGLCLVGMNGCDSGAAKLVAWWSDIAIDGRNLAWRALTRNQFDIEKETRIALAKTGAEKVLTAENMVDVLGSTSTWFEKVADLFAKSDAAVQTAVASGAYRWFDPRRLTLTLPLFAYLHQYLFRLLPANAVDRRLLAPMLGFIHAGLGTATTSLRMRDLAAAGQAANSNRVGGQVNSHIGRVRNTLATDFQNGGGGRFYQIRAGVIMAMIEGVILFVKATKMGEGERERLEFKAAGFVTAAAGIELAAVGVESVATRYGPTTVVGRGAGVALGGLRLGGGLLATVGGAMLVAMDIDDSRSSFQRKHRVLGGAYFARAVVSSGITLLATVVSFSYSGPLLRWLIGTNSQSSVILAVEALGKR